MCRCSAIVAAIAVLVLHAGCGQQSTSDQQRAPQQESASTKQPIDSGETAGDPGRTVAEPMTIPQANPDTDSAGPEESSATVPVAANTATSPEAILRRAADFYQGVKQIEVREEMETSIRMDGVDNNMTTQRITVVEKPARIAMRSVGEMSGVDLVSDGETLTTYMSVFNTYAEEPAPDTVEAVLNNPLLMGMNAGIGSFVLNLIASDPYERIMDGATDAAYVARETVDGVDTHHLRYTQEQFDWEIWIHAAGDPLVHRVSADMTKFLKAAGKGEIQVTAVLRFNDWKFNEPPAPDAFVFTPPEGAEKKDSLFEQFDGSEPEISPLIGKAAPEIELELLDGAKMNLAAHADKDIVMLDFWATWCGPCIQEMPVLVEVAEEYKDRNVVFYAVNQQEEPDVIQEFVDEHKLNISVALDSEGHAGTAYEVEGIPMLVLIDRAGIVQSVHVGFNPNIGQVLRQELDDLIAGKNLAEEAIRLREEREAAAPKPEGLEIAWTREGRYLSVTTDQANNEIVALRAGGHCERYNPAGEQQSTFEIGEDVSILRTARLTDDEAVEFVGFGAWGNTLAALSEEGTTLWKNVGGSGIDDVWVADLDADGLDEVIAGYNGGTGLHVFDSTGDRLWEYTEIGNVWHVTAGDVTGDGKTEVVTTSAAGVVHLFDTDGQSLQNLEAGLYANMVRVGRMLADDTADTIFVGGSADTGEQIAALDGEGLEHWRINLPDGAEHIDSMVVAPAGKLAAVGCREGIVCIIDLAEGQIVATAVDQGMTPQVNWATVRGEDDPLLLVATGRALNAFRLQTDAGNAKAETETPEP